MLSVFKEKNATFTTFYYQRSGEWKEGIHYIKHILMNFSQCDLDHAITN